MLQSAFVYIYNQFIYSRGGQPRPTNLTTDLLNHARLLGLAHPFRLAVQLQLVSIEAVLFSHLLSILSGIHSEQVARARHLLTHAVRSI